MRGLLDTHVLLWWLDEFWAAGADPAQARALPWTRTLSLCPTSTRT